MRRKIIEKIASSNLIQHLSKSTAPHWVVLLCDILIVFFSAFITLMCSGDSAGGMFKEPANVIILRTVAVTAVFAVVFFIVKPYRSIVRLSTTEDIYRIVLSVFIAMIFMVTGESLYQIYFHKPLVGLWNIAVISILSFSLMTITRMAIKSVFSAVATFNQSRTRVVVLGSAINSFALASALNAESEGRFRPVLMLSLGKRNLSSSVNGIPILPYDPDNIAEIFEQYHSDTLLFLSTQIEFMRSGGADVFLSNHIRLLMLNQIEEFDVNSDSQPTLSPHVQNIRIEDLLGRETIHTDDPAIAFNIRGQKVLISGAAGSIGSEIVRQVASFNAEKIILVDQAETPMHELQLEIENSFPDTDVELCIADVANSRRMTQIFEEFRPRIVFHAAAYKHVPMMEHNPTEAIITNVFGTKNLADLSLKYGAERFVMVSTDKAVNPTNIMGASKRIAEIYVQSLAHSLLQQNDGKSTRFITTRFGNVLGSNGSVIPLFRKQIESGGPVTVTHRDIIRYFMTIPEACSLVLEAACMGDGGEIFIFDMGKPIRIYDLATRMISLAGLRPGRDIEIVESGLRPGEKLFEELLNDHEMTTATRHKKIMIAKVRVYNYDEVCSRLDKLRIYAENGNAHDVVAQMKRIVPEFKSRNSQWEPIDSEISDNETMSEIILK